MTIGGESIWSIALKVINFGILVAVLVKFGKKPLQTFLVNRRNAVQEKIDEANRMLSQAQTLKHEYEEKLFRFPNIPRCIFN